MTPPLLSRHARQTGLLALGIVAALSACAADGASPSPVVAESSSAGTAIVEYPGMLAEYRAEAATLTLPEGARWIEPLEPEPELLPNGTMGTTSYGEGVGIGNAGNQWFCLWTREWLAQRGVDASAEAKALATMNTFVDTKAYLDYTDPAGHEFFGDILEQAALGDPTAAARHNDINCGSWLWDSAPSGAIS